MSQSTLIGQFLATVAGTALALVAALVVALALIILIRAFRSRRLAELGPWHADRVPEELRAADYAARPTLDELFASERRLAAAVDRRLGRADAPPLDRYRTGGRRHPGERNLSFLLTAEEPTCGALLLHGLSDSPYLMRSLAGTMHRDGATVLGLRLPGHGTAPGGLLSTRWQDWMAAAAYGVESLRERLDGRPLWIVGFSTGATLALLQAVETARRNDRQAASGLILMAPAVELPWVARFALWHRTLAWLPYFTKFRWQEVKPEYDPCKYGSFPKRAGAELYQLTRRLWSLARSLDARPAERSAADPRLPVACRRLARGQRHRLAAAHDRPGGRRAGAVRPQPLAGARGSAAGRRRSWPFPTPRWPRAIRRPFAVTLVTNRETGGGGVEALTWPAASGALGTAADARRRPLTERWPGSVFSLSHLALPVAADDPLYGAASEIGGAAPRGERGVLAQPLEDLLRLRWNPFFGYLAGRVAEILTRAR